MTTDLSPITAAVTDVTTVEGSVETLLSQQSKAVSAELRKLRTAHEVKVVRGQKRSSEWGLVAS